MAKVIITYDTSSKEIDVKMDGQAIDNVMSLCISKNGMYSDNETDEEYGCSITTMAKSESDGYKTYTQIVANEHGVKYLNKVDKNINDWYKSFRNRGVRR
jgi:hypothetical protein